jgi:Rrf2 family protein
MAHVINFSEAAFIALHGMVLVAKSEKEQINVLEIADRLNSSKHHVAKVMQRLVKEGYLYSHRGPTGGFSMKKDPKEVTLLELYESIEGKIEIGDCPMDHPVCAFDQCIFNNVTKKMTEEFVAYMSEQTLGSYL